MIAAWKRDYLNSGRRLDKDRRAGRWGAVATMIKRQMGGRWTARSIATLDDALRRAEEIHSWFTEGFDPADLQEARALLEEPT